MKIEKINDNQIRCTLNQQDLQSREIKISELAYGTQKAKDLFHDMIEQADHEFGFRTDDMPLMIEAIPISVDCIVLVITKVEDPEELDTRFSRFAPSDEDGAQTDRDTDGSDDFFDEKEVLEGLDGELPAAEAPAKESAPEPTDNFIPFSEMLRDATARIAPEIKDFIDTICSGIAQGDVTMPIENEDDITDSNGPIYEDDITDSDEPIYKDALTDEDESDSVEKTTSHEATADDTISEDADAEATRFAKPADEAKAPAEILSRIFSFDSWQEASYAASHINAQYDGDALLYKDENAGCYYLLLTGNAEDKIRFYAVSNELTEYAHKLKQTYATNAYLIEHCKLIIRTDALRILKEY